MDRAEVLDEITLAVKSINEGDITWTRHYLAQAAALLAAEEQRRATEPQGFPAAAGVPSLAGAQGAEEGEAPTVSPSVVCRACGVPIDAQHPGDEGLHNTCVD